MPRACPQTVGTDRRAVTRRRRTGSVLPSCQEPSFAESSALMRWDAALGAQAGLTGLAALFVYLLLRRQRRGFGTLQQRATLRTLAFATSTLRSLRRGLTAGSAQRVL